MVGHGEVLHDLGEQAVQLLGSGCGAVQFKRHVNSVPRGRRAQHTHYMRFCGRIHFMCHTGVAKGRIMPGLISAMQRLLRYRHRNRGGICCRTNANRRAVPLRWCSTGSPSSYRGPCLMFAILSKGADFRHLPPLDYRGVLLRRAGRRGVPGAQPHVLPPGCPGRHHHRLP